MSNQQGDHQSLKQNSEPQQPTQQLEKTYEQSIQTDPITKAAHLLRSLYDRF